MPLPDTLIDTCCLINVCAVGDLRIVLPFLRLKWNVARAVAAEALSIRPGPDAKRSDRRRVDLQPCFDAGILKICEPQDEAERSLYVELAQDVDDGEAMSLAIAAIRGWALSTDDLAARRVAHRLNVIAVSTPELVRLWAENSRADPAAIGQAISNIELLARYIPMPAVAEYQWWRDHRIS